MSAHAICKSNLLLPILLLGLAIHLTLSYQLQPTGSGSNTSNPYWRRPGCYRVGHTRTISIPGCVKFNLSTNACRGYCMSYAIPAFEDLGPLAQTELFVDDTTQKVEITEDKFQAKQGETSLLDGGGAKALKSWSLQSGEQVGVAGGQSKSGGSKLRVRLTDQSVGPTLGNVAGAGDKRHLVSVSQCCNMMETEEVVVNLRCGASEIRRLVFKSAKTCECFFCKKYV